MTQLRLALLGLGNVAQAFLHLLAHKAAEFNRYNLQPVLVGVATRSHGAVINPAGLDITQLLAARSVQHSLDQLHLTQPILDTTEFVRRVEADVLVECITLNPTTGQPAIDYLRTALQRNLHVITANKSAPAFAYPELTALARRQQRAFLFEATVMDGAPVFSLVRETLPATELQGFRGILNSTTNFILTAMEEGLPPEDALRRAQALGIAEKNPDYDLDGWDAAAKTAILVNALFNEPLAPPQVHRTGIRHLTTRTVIEAARQGRRFKLIAEARRWESGVTARVIPRILPLTNPLAHVSGTSAALTLSTDTLGDLTFQLTEGEVPQTAYGLFADLITIIKRYYA